MTGFWGDGALVAARSLAAARPLALDRPVAPDWHGIRHRTGTAADTASDTAPTQTGDLAW
jgi:hypothetical protein